MIAAINPMAAGTQALPGLAGLGAQTSATISGDSAAGPQPFADLLTDAVGQVNQLESQAQAAVTGLMTGTGVDVHQAMIATQKASMAFELALAVRNKAVQAYQSVIGMQF
jgi:flagellar hook-basal body complex protein FliE